MTSINEHGYSNTLAFNCYHPSLHGFSAMPLKKNPGPGVVPTDAPRSIADVNIPLGNYKENFQKWIGDRVLEYEIGFVHLNESSMIRHQICGLGDLSLEFKEENTGSQMNFDLAKDQQNKKACSEIENELDEKFGSEPSEDGEGFQGQDNKEHKGLNHYLEKLNRWHTCLGLIKAEIYLI